jgi:hypothetical protein
LLPSWVLAFFLLRLCGTIRSMLFSAPSGSEPYARICDQALGALSEEARRERRFYERDLVRRSARRAYGERKTRSVCQCHELGALSRLDFPPTQPPFGAHPLLRPFSTISSASRRASSSSVSFILRSSSRSRAWLLIIWLTAVAAPRSTSPESTSAASFLSCALSSAISALALLRPPLEALRRRSAARLGSWL